jgi:acetaldehyde dehydrogenase (acetylating)
MQEPSPLIQLILARLERISADSPLAHQASGLRGALLRSLQAQEHGLPVHAGELKRSIDSALAILTKAAAEIPSGRRARN